MLAIRPARHFHLQHAEIDPQLQLIATVEPRYFPDLNHARLVGPLFQDRIEIQAHRIEMIVYPM
jgi:hypothetical protein